MQRPKPKALITTGMIVLGIGLVAQTAAADIGPAPDFAVTDFGGVPDAEGDVVTISVEGCEQGSSTTITNWHTQATLEGPIGSFNPIISGGISTATDPNPDGTWTFSLVFEDQSLGLQPSPTPGTYRIRLECSRWNGDNPGQVELINIAYEFQWGEGVSTTTTTPRTTVEPTTPPTDDGQGTTAPAPTDPPVVDTDEGELPRTGSSSVPLALLGAGLLGLGAAANVGRRRLAVR